MRRVPLLQSPFFVGTLCAVVAFMFGAWWDGVVHKKEHPTECKNEYTFVNADIVCGTPDVIRKTGYLTTQRRIDELLQEYRRKGALSNASVYFRDLKHGPTFGINELEAFAPASLLKLPLAFVFLGTAESQPGLLTKKIEYTGTTSVSEQRIRPQESAQPNTPYTIEELLRMMVAFSDNASYEALESFLAADLHRQKIRLEILQEIGLIDPKNRIEETVTVRGYASLFRLLYNASYLDVAYAEKLLSWLALSTFDRGLVAGVPKGVTVAHKFGERFTSEFEKQLHDCGIVYYPGNPYLLCVMTRGKEWSELEHVIAAVSREVYNEVHSRRI